jgi:hypothetical protein
MFRIFIAYIWLFHIIATTVGFNVHRIYCACTGQVGLSLVQHEEHKSTPAALEMDCCAEKQNTRDCCEKVEAEPVAACCKTETTAARPDGVCSGTKDCMQDEVFVLQLDTDLQIAEIQKADALASLDVFSLSHIFLYPDRPSVLKVLAPASYRGPPILPYGKALLPHIQVWLC